MMKVRVTKIFWRSGQFEVSFETLEMNVLSCGPSKDQMEIKLEFPQLLFSVEIFLTSIELKEIDFCQ